MNDLRNEQILRESSDRNTAIKPDIRDCKQDTNLPEENEYPGYMIIFWYGLCGGGVGGAILAAFLIRDILTVLFLFIFYGILIGFIPACLTGAWLAKHKINISKASDWITVFVCGFCATFFVTLSCQTTIFSDIPAHLANPITSSLGMGMLGGMSSLIVGAFALPRSKK